MAGENSNGNESNSSDVDENVDDTGQQTGEDGDDGTGRDDGAGHRDGRGRGRGQQSGDDRDGQDRTFTQADVEKIVADRITRERKKYAGYDDLKKKASQFDELQDKNKTELEKVNDQLNAAQVELQGYRVEKIRMDAARQVGLDLELAEFITAVDEDEAVEQAKRLLARLGSRGNENDGEGGDNAGGGGRRADFKQGTRRGPQKTEMTRDDLIRGLAGFRRT